MARLADDVIAVMDALEIPQAHFCGISVGGMIGQTLGLRHPERLLSLALVATNSQTPMEAHPMWHNRIGQAEAHGMAGMADATLERWLTPAFRAAHPDVVARIHAMLVATPVLRCDAAAAWRASSATSAWAAARRTWGRESPCRSFTSGGTASGQVKPWRCAQAMAAAACYFRSASGRSRAPIHSGLSLGESFRIGSAMMMRGSACITESSRGVSSAQARRAGNFARTSPVL